MKDGESVGIDVTLSGLETAALGMLFDTYHTDGLYEEQLKLSTAFFEKFPEKTTICRNHARAIEDTGDLKNALCWYKKAILCDDVDDVSAVWYGNTLHNDQRNVDAAEAYLLACLMDPDEPETFAHVAHELSYIQFGHLRGKVDSRSMPADDLPGLLRKFVIASLSCARQSEAALRLCVDAGRRIGVDLSSEIGALLGSGDESRRLKLADRIGLAREVYEKLASRVTRVEA